MIFMFWTGSKSEEPAGAPAWRVRFRDIFRVFNDDDVIPLLDSEIYRDCYRRISIPACKADIARLVLLREHGGLYIDRHTAPTSGDGLIKTMINLSRYDLILFLQGWKPTFEFIGNAVMMARSRAPILDALIEKAFNNLLRHKELEEASNSFVPYDIIQLTGSPLFIGCVFDESDANAWTPAWRPRPELKERVLLYVKERTDSDIGFEPWQFYHYRNDGQHWTERQTRERLFQRNHESRVPG